MTSPLDYTDLEDYLDSLQRPAALMLNDLCVEVDEYDRLVAKAIETGIGRVVEITYTSYLRHEARED